jgi:hypothetical protein
MANGVGLANPVGNAVKTSFALAVAAGGAEDFVPMLATHVGRANGIDLSPAKKG